jgi:hypothetical protein
MKKFLIFTILLLFVFAGCKKIKDLETPQNVHASISGNTVTVTWSSVDGAEKYHIFYKMSGYMTTSGQFLELSENPTGTIYTNYLGSADGTTYTYEVCAEKSGKFSGFGTSNSLAH